MSRGQRAAAARGIGTGNLIKGAANRSAVGTLVCRKTQFVMLVKMDGVTAIDALKGSDHMIGVNLLHDGGFTRAY